jgi:hypothetical protein
MPRRTDVEDEWEEEDDSESDDEAFDSSDDDEDETIPCPYCRRPIFEGAERCPYCENYISEEDAPVRKPLWLLVGVILCLIVVYLWIVRG